jgi:hypothetical protein
MRREAWFGITIMAIVVIGVFWAMPPLTQWTTGHLGLLMLAMIVIAIMLGFPTAFTLMGMGTMFAFFSYYSQTRIRRGHVRSGRAAGLCRREQRRTDLDTAVRLHGYLVERAN